MPKSSTPINFLTVCIYKIGITQHHFASCYFYLILYLGCNMVQGNNDPAGYLPITD